MTDTSDLVERLREQAANDHVRGCMGRQYSCDCGYDLATEGLLDQAATAIKAQTKEIEVLRVERDDALSRVDKLELNAEVVSDEFEKDCWKAMRRLLEACKFDWRGVDLGEGVSADSAYEYIKECIDELGADGHRSRACAETAERRVAEQQAFMRELTDALRAVRPLGGSELFVRKWGEHYADPVYCKAAIEQRTEAYHEAMKELVCERKRAINAERERDEARAAIQVAEQMVSEHIEEFHDFDYAPHEVPRELSQLRGIQHHLLGSLIDENGEPFRAARAVIKQGE